MYDMVETSHAHLNAGLDTWGELEVLSTKFFFKVFEKSKSNSTVKMRK